MKSFLISVGVFLLVTAFVFFASWYVRNACCAILETVRPMRVSDDFAALSARWEKERVRFRAVVGHTETDPADTALEDLRSWAGSGNADEFAAAKARFLAAVESIRACETFSLDSVF